jgi:hypothetical protein
MRLSTAALTLAGSTLATAVAATEAPNTFEVTNFSFGCTTDCAWTFSATVTGDHPPNHPALTTPVTCSGSFTGPDDPNGSQYTPCSKTDSPEGSSTELYARIDAKTNELGFLYYVYTPTGHNYLYLGEKTVYAATGPDAEKQASAFSVVESSHRDETRH